MSLRRGAIVALSFMAAALAAREYGPAVGSRMPDFTLQDQDGMQRSLKTLLGRRGAVILLFRSADWCPYCKNQLAELQEHLEDFQKRGIGVAAISYDSPAVLHAFAERKRIRFPMLSDPDSKLIRQLGIFNDTVAKDSPYYGVPHPGSFVLDADGKITAKYFTDDDRERYTSGALLFRQFGVIPPTAKIPVAGKQLDLIAFASNTGVTTGQRITLSLDMELRPEMHVYAPGVDGYIPIDWKMTASDAIVARDPSYPPSQKLFMKAINETVPTYQGTFRVTREIEIGPEDKIKPLLDRSGYFSIQGALRYQACDERICYVPQELPLKWTFRYEPLDEQRVPAELQRKTVSRR